MAFFSFLGVESFYFLVMPALLWCYDVTVGFRVGIILLTSSTLNGVLKLALGMPRPFWISQKIEARAVETSFGLPSGHAQNAVSVWGRLALAVGSSRALAAAVILTGLISLSRLYLGVHFPLDILAGWLVGGVILAGFVRLERPVWRLFSALTSVGRVGVIVVLSLGALWLGLSVLGQAVARSLPADWLPNIAFAQVDGQFIDPRSPESIFTTTGTFFGLALGGLLLRRWGGFRADGPWPTRAARYAIGAFGVSLFFFGLDFIGPGEGTSAFFWWTYARFALIGLWIAYLAPRLFAALGLVPGSDHESG